MKLLKDGIANKIQLAGEVNGALAEHNVVLVTKSAGDSPVYRVYGDQVPDGTISLQCEVKDGQLESL